MNLLKRAEPRAAAVACGLVFRTVATIALLAMLCVSAATAHAMNRTSRVRARSAAREQELLPTRARRHGYAVARPVATVRGRRRVIEAAEPVAHRVGRRGVHAEAVREAPVSRREALRGVALKRGRHAAEVETIAAPRRERRAVPREEAARVAAPAAKQTLSGDDFLRAADPTAGSASVVVRPNAEGVSHPDEMDDEQPTPRVAANAGTARGAKSAPALPEVSANDAPRVSSAAASRRVDGFGAEGVVAPATAGHRTLAATMAAHRAQSNAPHFSAAEQEAITDDAVKPMVLPAVYTSGGRLLMPAPLKGSHEVLVHQNLMADSEGLERIQNDDQLDRMIDNHELLRLPESASLHVNEELPEDRRYARPWTVRFAEQTARAFAAQFGEPLEVNSAVRTVAYQLRLMRVNGNAAAIEGETASPHLTGQAIDFGKRSMTKAELAWMRAYLLPIMQAGQIDVEEEFQQACFHISVYRSYGGGARHKVDVAQLQPAQTTPAPIVRYTPPAVADEDVQP